MHVGHVSRKVRHFMLLAKMPNTTFDLFARSYVCGTVVENMSNNKSELQRQTTVTAYFTNKRLLIFAPCLDYSLVSGVRVRAVDIDITGVLCPDRVSVFLPVTENTFGLSFADHTFVTLSNPGAARLDSWASSGRITWLARLNAQQNRTHWTNAILMLRQRRRRWPNIKIALVQCVVLLDGHYRRLAGLSSDLRMLSSKYLIHGAHHLLECPPIILDHSLLTPCQLIFNMTCHLLLLQSKLNQKSCLDIATSNK